MAETEMGYSTDVGAGGSQASGAAGAAREKFDEAKHKVGGAAKSKVTGKLDHQKSQLAGGLDKLASSIDDLSRSLDGPQAQIATRVAGYVRNAHDTIERRSSDELVNMAVTELKNRPAIVIGAMFAVGFIGARFLKS